MRDPAEPGPADANADPQLDAETVQDLEAAESAADQVRGGQRITGSNTQPFCTGF